MSHATIGRPFSKLSCRGWVFQEYILTKRTLYFGLSELARECRDIISCECSATTEYVCRKSTLVKDLLDANSWPNLVAKFTRLSLTFLEDGLAAMLGHERAIRPKASDYIAELETRPLFAGGLLWRRARSGRLQRFGT
jgi:hypothetical protein